MQPSIVQRRRLSDGRRGSFLPPAVASPHVVGASCEACLRPASEVPAPDVAVCDSGVQLWQQPQLCSDTGHVASVRGNVPQCVGNVLQGTHRPCSPDVVFGVRGNDPLCAANVLRETCVHAPTCRADVLDLSSRQRLDDRKGKPVESSRALTDRSLGEAAQSHSSSEVQSLEGAPLFIEVCCGCARLSARVRQCGFRVLAIDQSSNRHKPVFSVHRLDVRNALRPVDGRLRTALLGHLLFGATSFPWVCLAWCRVTHQE